MPASEKVRYLGGTPRSVTGRDATPRIIDCQASRLLVPGRVATMGSKNLFLNFGTPWVAHTRAARRCSSKITTCFAYCPLGQLTTNERLPSLTLSLK